MAPDWVLFAIPACAIALRVFLSLKFSLIANQVPTEDELDRKGNREIILPLAGFSFTALLGLVVLDANKVTGLRTPIILLLLSFLAFYGALNLQAYKARRWQDQVGSALKESAAGWLLFSVVAIVGSSPAGAGFRLAVTLLAVVVWVGDFAIRYAIDYAFYRDHEAVP